MERLVLGLEKITFQGNLQSEFAENIAVPTVVDCPQFLKFTIENCLPNMNIRSDEQMPKNHGISSFSSIDNEVEAEDSSDTNSTSTIVSDENNEDADEHDSQSAANEDMQPTYSGVNNRLRNLRSRASRQNLQNKPDLRTTMKPSKVCPKGKRIFQPSDIKNLYCNQKLTRFHPTKLETIFEEPQPTRSRLPNTSSNDDALFRWIGTTKLKRSLNCCDGFNINKSLVKRRRAMIKKKFGRRHTWKKMPLASFIEHMQKTENPESEHEDNELEMKNSEVSNQNSIETAPNIAEKEQMGD